MPDLSHFFPAVTLSPCGTDYTLELVENTASNQVTCTGFTASDTAVWRVLLPADNQIALCAPLPGSSGTNTCLDAIKPPFTASRTVSDRTSLTVDTTDEATYGIVFKGTTLVCRTNTQTNDQGYQCRMDLVGECSRLFFLLLCLICPFIVFRDSLFVCYFLLPFISCFLEPSHCCGSHSSMCVCVCGWGGGGSFVFFLCDNCSYNSSAGERGGE